MMNVIGLWSKKPISRKTENRLAKMPSRIQPRAGCTFLASR